MSKEIEISKGTIRRIEAIISNIDSAIKAIEKEERYVKFRGDDPPLCYAYIDLFSLDDALTVLNSCVPTFFKVSEWEKERVSLNERLNTIVRGKFSDEERLLIVRSILENRLEDLRDYVSVLPKNISPSGDGFGNLLSKRHSIEALLQRIKLELGENPYSLVVAEIDQMLKDGANPEWLAPDETCEEQLLELAPPSRWWFYRKGYNFNNLAS